MSEFQSNVGRRVKFIFRGGVGIDSCGAAEQMNITEPERSGVRVVGFRVFAGTQKKVEPQEKHIRNGIGLCCVGKAAQLGCMGYDGQGDGFDAMRGRVQPVVATNLAVEAKFYFP